MTLTLPAALQTAARYAAALLTAGGLFVGLAGTSFAQPAPAPVQEPAAKGGRCLVIQADLPGADEDAKLLRKINDYRREHGRTALAENAMLTNAALWASVDNAERGFLPANHVDTLGRGVEERVRDCGYTNYSWVAENIYSGGGNLGDADSAFLAWRNSAVHNSNMLDARARVAGIARVCQGATCYFTLNLGSDAGAAANPAPAPAPAPMSAAAWPTVRIGAQGESVTAMQHLLRQHGLGVTVDGDFGPQTHDALRAFQAGRGVVEDGAGSNTWQALIVTVQEGSTGEAVLAGQSLLAARGVAVAVDGDFGPQTTSAVQDYQRSRGLEVDGVVGPQTWQALLTGR